MDGIERSGLDATRQDLIHRTRPAGPDRRADRAEEPSVEAASSGEVTLSETAKLMAALKRAVEETPDVREDRVRELREAVENGTYRPDDREIAKHILGLEDD